ncbi:histidinol-phosphatase [Desulfovibrio sp. OttesenSCG-928-G15]|nr:histidinol-phosphatase [Desulfovibrio sp. OttesenSCG-928-G15]
MNRPAVLADLHSHTSHSHGQNSVEEMHRAALARGLAVYGFSEHSPRPSGYTYPTDYQPKLLAGFDRYIAEVSALRDAESKDGKDAMRVLLALEVDFIAEEVDYARTLVAAHDYDYIIGGLHFQGTWGFDFCAQDWAALSQEQRFAAYERYYRDLAAMCETGLFHIAAHPDLIKLFTIDDFTLWLATPASRTLIDTALQAMKANNMAMEVSSAGLRKPCKEIYPGPVLMERAAALGLPISIGSDAHCINTPAYAFDQLASYAASFGYTGSVVIEGGATRVLPFNIQA